jgi:hypothetical protein
MRGNIRVSLTSGNVVTETEVAEDELEHGYADSATHMLYRE